MDSKNTLYFLPAAALIGVTIGYLVRPMIAPTPAPETRTETIEVEKEIDPAKLAAMCAELNPTERVQLQKAQDQVTALSSQLEARELELAELKDAAQRGREAGAKAAAKMKALEAEVATLREQLTTVTAERDNLIVELKDTVKKLEDQIQQTTYFKAEAKKWKTQSTENAWRSFTAEAQVAICDRGTRKRHEKCHEAVKASMTAAIQDHFETCVDTYQAVPTLAQLEKRAELPVFAQLLFDRKEFTSHGWFIQFCDPTLPESKRKADVADPDVPEADAADFGE